MTGKPYQVVCSGETMNSSAWLPAELEKLRRKPAGGEP